ERCCASLSLRQPPTWRGRKCSRRRQAKSARRSFPRRPTCPCRFPRSNPRRRLLFRSVVTPREPNADARIKIRATVGFAKRIDVERGPRLAFSGHVSVDVRRSRPPSKTPAFAGVNSSGNPGPRAGFPLRGTPRGDAREQSLKTLPANCCDATHCETSLRASRLSIIL